jgi:hypothetical protein
VNATDLESNAEEKEAVAKYHEIPNKEVAVEIIAALEDRYRDRHLATSCSRQPKKRTQGDGGSQQKLAAARERLTAVPLLHCARKVLVDDLTKHPETGSDGKAGDRRYV